MNGRTWVLVAAAVAATACGGGAKAPAPVARIDLATPFARALREEAVGDPEAAKRLYLDVVDAAVRAPTDPASLPAIAASLDALVFRRIPALAEVSPDDALVFRTRDHALYPQSTKPQSPPEATLDRLPRALRDADDPFAAGLIARALQHIAEHHGDGPGAARWRAASGCAREATVVGPLAWASVTGVAEDGDPLARHDAPVPATTALPGPFATPTPPVVVRDRGCAIELGAANALRGVRDVVVDVKIPKAQTIGVALWSTAPAVLRAGGRLAITRPYELGGGAVARFARVVVAKPGTLRLVARVGMDADGDVVEIGAWDAHGAPLEAHAPRAGEAANVEAASVQAPAQAIPRLNGTAAEKVLSAAGALALGDGRSAERGLAADAASPNARPELELVYARAVETARDLPSVQRAERARAAYEKVLDGWPASWEAAIAHAVLAGVRRGQNEQRIESLVDLDKRRAKAGAWALPLLDAFEAATSGREGLFDRARAAFDRAKGPLDGTALLYDAGRAAFARTGGEAVAYACSEKAPNGRAGFECHDALWSAGDRAGAEKELDRVRGVLGTKDAFLGTTLRDALATGDTSRTTALLQRMLPGERTLTAIFTSNASHDARALLAASLTARDAPHVLPALLRAAGDDPTTAFSGVAERVVEADRANPILPSAPTAILAHTERFAVEPTGLVHYAMLDVRRVSGTTDVEQNAQAIPPSLTGREVFRALRRRIFKKDGRILEPDRTPHASQSHADLSQLEQGDCVEAIYEGWAMPGETGDVGLDTPDLLSDRTAVHDATIELRLPPSLKGALWSHPLLGKAAERADAGARVLTWKMADRPVRRIEDGVPKMDRSVGISFSTAQWTGVGRALREALAALDEHDPEIARWARNAAADSDGAIPLVAVADRGVETSCSEVGNECFGKERGPVMGFDRRVIPRIVEAAGNAVKEASPSSLVDLDGAGADGPQSMTARTILATREGSRTWLVARALRELDIAVDVVVAENEPFSADPAFPPHFGRFMHPLAVAHIPELPAYQARAAEPAHDVWIDADVPGPPLPAGRISPELRGRMAIRTDGTIAPLPAMGGDSERDEVDIRLSLDEKGDAKGSLTVLLRGRAAQELAEALVRTVGAERQRALRGVALAWAPYANIDDVQLSSSEGSWQVALRAEVTIPGYAQIEGAGAARTWVLPGIDPVHAMFPRAHVTTLGATYANRSARENALAISQAMQYHVRRRVELPAGATIVRTPGPFETKSPQLEAARTFTVNGTVIEEDFVLGVATGTVAQDGYGAFVSNAHKTDDAFLANTRVRPRG